MPDKRLNPRLENILTHLSRRPTDPITQAFDDPADVKATYRFIENERVRPAHLRNAFSKKTVLDAAGHKEILVVQDTTTLSFPNAPATKGLGAICDKDVSGLLVHSALTIAADGKPLGLVAQDVWKRDKRKTQTPAQRARLPIEEKESYKWIRGMETTRENFAEQLPPQKRPRLIHVFDREGDIYDVFENVKSHNDGCVIRSSQNRRVRDSDGTFSKAHDLVKRATLLGSAKVEIMRRGDRPARTASVEIRSVELSFESNSAHRSKRAPLSLRMIEAREVDAPNGTAEPILWRLLTTESCGTFQAALRVVRYYARRWLIEEIHLIFKSGCRIEEVRFHTAERIEKALALYGPVAVLILQLREFSRLDPEVSCEELLDDLTWRVLYSAVHRRPAPQAMGPPTIREAILWIGRLGGHLGRKGDGMPGVRVLWRGWRDLCVLTSLAESIGFSSHSE